MAFIVDMNSRFIYNAVEKYACWRGYRSLRIKMNDNFEPNEVRITARRLRIADVKEQSKQMISKTDGEFVLGLEDDTIIGEADGDIIERLLKPFKQPTALPIGFVQGVQCGRWGGRMIGAWEFDDINNPQEAWTVQFEKRDGYQTIDAGGFYGYLTRTKQYLDFENHWSREQPWGPDVNYGLWLRRQGFMNVMCSSLVFGHNSHRGILYPNEKTGTIRYYWDDERWKLESIAPPLKVRTTV